LVSRSARRPVGTCDWRQDRCPRVQRRMTSATTTMIKMSRTTPPPMYMIPPSLGSVVDDEVPNRCGDRCRCGRDRASPRGRPDGIRQGQQQKRRPGPPSREVSTSPRWNTSRSRRTSKSEWSANQGPEQRSEELISSPFTLPPLRAERHRRTIWRGSGPRHHVKNQFRGPFREVGKGLWRCREHSARTEREQP
jgi:hypothetical protein